MKSGHCWQAICSKCDHAIDFEWVEERPARTPDDCGWCDTKGEDACWQYVYVEPIGTSAWMYNEFSTSESAFTPHFNRSFGRHVHSLAEMKHLQRASGAVDAVAKGDAAERLVPRDIKSRLRHHAEAPERLKKLGYWTED